MRSGQVEPKSARSALHASGSSAGCDAGLKAFFVLSLLLTSCLPLPAMAVGLGQLEVRSTLAQPFDARIPVFGVPDAELDSLSAHLGNEALFHQTGIDRTAYLMTLRFEVVTADKRHPYIRITSAEPVKEPSLDFLVEVRTDSATLVQHCVALFDPPAQH